MRVAKGVVASITLVMSVGLLFSLLFLNGKNETYRVEPFVTLPWIKDNRAEGVGLIRVKDGSYYGPRSFAVDNRGGVILLDSASRRVLWFDRDGRKKGVWFVPAGGRNSLLDQIAVDEKGRLVVSDNACGMLHIMDKGQWQRVELGSGFCEGARIGRFESLAAGDGVAYALFLALDRERLKRQVLRIDLQKQPLSVEVLMEAEVTETSLKGVVNRGTKVDALINSLTVDPKGRVYLGGWERVKENGGELRYVVSQLQHQASGRSLRKVVAVESPFFRTRLAGVDKKGRFYLVASPGYKEGVVRKIDPKGAILWEGKGFWTGGVRAISYVTVSAAGDIYLLQPLAEGLTISRLLLTKRQ